MKGVVMTTDEQTNTDNGLDDTNVSLEGRMAEDTFAENDTDFDDLGATGILNRDALNQQLGGFDAQTEDEVGGQVPEDAPAEAHSTSTNEDTPSVILPNVA